MQPDAASLIREYAPFVWRVLRHLGVLEDQLEDVSQEVFLTVFKQLPQFEGRSSLRTWIYGICWNVAASFRRQRKARRECVREEPPEASELASQDSNVWLKQAHAQLIRALETLDESQQAVFVLYEIEELSMEEIARALATPLTTCYSRLYTARARVQSFVRREEERRSSRLAWGGAK
jgi:RNA polymerase sigma-70 factor (ECF subfamily)